MTTKTASVVLLSGGMDSCVAGFLERRDYGTPECLAIEYGQRHFVELDSARLVAKILGANLRLANLGERGIAFGSALTDRKGEITPSNSVVPARNVFFLLAAAALAQKIGATRVVIGSCADDHADYPDCRPETIAAVQVAARLALDYSALEIVAPLAHMDKLAIVTLAHELGPECVGALRLTWSCYDPQFGEALRDRKPCGVCPACAKRMAVGL
jgi:7-cyano-7-deazaguanine synthase